MFSLEISFLSVLSDWSHHFRPDFCFFDGGPFFRNLTTCFVFSSSVVVKDLTIASRSRLGRFKRASSSCSWSWKSGLLSRSMASSVQSNLRSGEGVEQSFCWRFLLWWRFSSVIMMEWSERIELCRPTWKFRIDSLRVVDTIP